MDENNESSSTKGSLKNRLFVLNILLRISRKKKLRLQFKKINETRILKSRRFSLFFYKPIMLTLDSEISFNNLRLYTSDSCKRKLIRTKESHKDVDIYVCKIRNFKKGIGPLEDILKNNEETATFPIVDGLPDKDTVIKYIESNAVSLDFIKGYAKIYNVDESSLDLDDIYNILVLRTCSKSIFKEELNNEEIKEMVDICLTSKKITNELIICEDLLTEKLDEKQKNELSNKTKNKENVSLEKTYDFEKKLKQFLKSNKETYNYSEYVALIAKYINDYELQTITETNFKGFDKLLRNFLGLSWGILTLPFSRSTSFVLGSSLINKSVTAMKNSVVVEEKEKVVRNYTITANDIKSATSRIKTSSFLLSDALDKLQAFKAEINLHKDEISNYQKALKQLNLIEKGLIIKSEKIKVLEESLEKSKIKVLERKI